MSQNELIQPDYPSEESQNFEMEKPALWMNEYAPGEVRLYPKTDKVFDDQGKKDDFLKKSSGRIKLVLNVWSKGKYGKEIFRIYDDGEGIRIQTGMHDLTLEDKKKIQEVVTQSNESESQ